MSVLMWLVYLYLIREALTEFYGLFKESLEWAFAGAEPPDLPAISSFIDTMRGHGIVILAICTCVIVWAVYNRFRFSGQDQHHAHKTVSIVELAGLYGLPPEDVETWQHARILVMRHDNAGVLVEVTSKEPEGEGHSKILPGNGQSIASIDVESLPLSP